MWSRIFSFLFGRAPFEQKDTLTYNSAPCPPPALGNSLASSASKEKVSSDISTTSSYVTADDLILCENLSESQIEDKPMGANDGDVDRRMGQCKRSAFEHPYNEMLSEVAAGLAALDFGKYDMHGFEESHICEDRSCSIDSQNADDRRAYEVNAHKFPGFEIAKYSQVLQQILRDNGASAQCIGEKEEYELHQHFQLSVVPVNCFCYLLIDPSMIADFKRCSFQEFVDAIFYVGKGTGSRPFTHLIDACNLRRTNVSKMLEKEKRILDLWDRKIGVISLPFCHNIPTDEALIREACVIEAIGIKNLTNVRRGKVTGLPTVWTHKRITELGASLLYTVHGIFVRERCRPILEIEVAAMSRQNNAQPRA